MFITYKDIENLLKKEKLLIKYKISNDNHINSISCNSICSKKNSLFFCKGNKFKKEYLAEAIKNGAICYISEIFYKEDNVSYFIVSDILKAMAVISANFYNYPAQALELIGITGTKGKTTTTYFLKNIFESFLQSKVGVISSVNISTGKKIKESHLTTPESIELHSILNEVKQNNLKYTIMEVSSQSYKRDRLYGVEFEYGIFTNIAEDHISQIEHPTFVDYLNCKIEFLKNCKTVIINKNTNCLSKILSQIQDKNIIFYGTDNTADYYVTDIVKQKNGFKFKVINEKENYSHIFKIKMNGRFNIENALAAIVVSKLNNIDDETIYNSLYKTQVLGRMNIYEKKGITVIVDYAHNGYSFEKLFESIKTDYPNRKIISVGGMVGGKAFNRRREFGEIVGNNSDYIYLTANDPQFEEVQDICRDIAKYIPQKNKYEIIVDRKKAVEKAIIESKKGDIILLLAKGRRKLYKSKKRKFSI